MVGKAWKASRVASLVLLAGLIGQAAVAVEPLHRIREPAAPASFASASASATGVDASARTWLELLGRWLRNRRGGAWTGAESLQLGPETGNNDAGPIATARLRATDTLEIRFASQSCFGRAAGVLTYAADSARFALSNTQGGSSIDLGQTGVAMCREPALSRADLPAIDALLQHLRRDNGGGCSSVSTIDVTWRRGAAVVASEHYQDASCALPAGALNLDTLWATSCFAF